MQTTENIIDCYNKTAESYSAKFIDELDKKHFDRLILKEFATHNKDRGLMADFGCGPGQTTRFLHQNGSRKMIGIDISMAMVNIAQKNSPTIKFESGDLLHLSYQNNYFGSAIAFYAIVHFTYEQVAQALNEVYRVLKPNAQFLFSFHIGTEIVHLTNFLDAEVEIDFYFFETEKIIELVINSGFKIIDIIERHPYKDVEYASKRAYIWVEKI
jgi:ubiquinone/menaquinone biosynthesis C-methylase UbiE